MDSCVNARWVRAGDGVVGAWAGTWVVVRGEGRVLALLPHMSLAHEVGSGENGAREGAAILNGGHDGVQRGQVNGSWAELGKGEHV